MQFSWFDQWPFLCYAVMKEETLYFAILYVMAVKHKQMNEAESQWRWHANFAFQSGLFTKNLLGDDLGQFCLVSSWILMSLKIYAVHAHLHVYSPTTSQLLAMALHVTEVYRNAHIQSLLDYKRVFLSSQFLGYLTCLLLYLSNGMPNGYTSSTILFARSVVIHHSILTTNYFSVHGFLDIWCVYYYISATECLITTLPAPFCHPPSLPPSLPPSSPPSHLPSSLSSSPESPHRACSTGISTKRQKVLRYYSCTWVCGSNEEDQRLQNVSSCSGPPPLCESNRLW